MQIKKRYIWTLSAGFSAAAIFLFLFANHSLKNEPSKENKKMDTEVSVKKPHQNTNAEASVAKVATPPQIRQPSSSNTGRAIDELNKESIAPWFVKRHRDGTISILSDSAWPSGEPDPQSAARQFLQKYSRSLLGLDGGALIIDVIKSEGESTQIIFHEEKNGLAVIPSRVNMIFNDKMQLVYLASDVSDGAIEEGDQDIGSRRASEIARVALFSHLMERGEGGNLDLPVSHFEALAQKCFYLSEKKTTLVYRYQVRLENPTLGDLEIIISASDGAVLVVRDLIRK